MSKPGEYLEKILSLGDGARPAHIEPVELEHALAALLALTGEVSVLTERVNRLEHQLAQTRGVDVETLREDELGEAVEAEHAGARDALLLRVLHTVVADYETATAHE